MRNLLLLEQEPQSLGALADLRPLCLGQGVPRVTRVVVHVLTKAALAFARIRSGIEERY